MKVLVSDRIQKILQLCTVMIIGLIVLSGCFSSKYEKDAIKDAEHLFSAPPNSVPPDSFMDALSGVRFISGNLSSAVSGWKSLGEVSPPDNQSFATLIKENVNSSDQLLILVSPTANARLYNGAVVKPDGNHVPLPFAVPSGVKEKNNLRISSSGFVPNSVKFCVAVTSGSQPVSSSDTAVIVSSLGVVRGSEGCSADGKAL